MSAVSTSIMVMSMRDWRSPSCFSVTSILLWRLLRSWRSASALISMTCLEILEWSSLHFSLAFMPLAMTWSSAWPQSNFLVEMVRVLRSRHIFSYLASAFRVASFSFLASLAVESARLLCPDADEFMVDCSGVGISSQRVAFKSESSFVMDSCLAVAASPSLVRSCSGC